MTCDVFGGMRLRAIRVRQSVDEWAAQDLAIRAWGVCNIVKEDWPESPWAGCKYRKAEKGEFPT